MVNNVHSSVSMLPWRYKRVTRMLGCAGVGYGHAVGVPNRRFHDVGGDNRPRQGLRWMGIPRRRANGLPPRAPPRPRNLEATRVGVQARWLDVLQECNTSRLEAKKHLGYAS